MFYGSTVCCCRCCSARQLTFPSLSFLSLPLAHGSLRNHLALKFSPFNVHATLQPTPTTLFPPPPSHPHHAEQQQRQQQQQQQQQASSFASFSPPFPATANSTRVPRVPAVSPEINPAITPYLRPPPPSPPPPSTTTTVAINGL